MNVLLAQLQDPKPVIKKRASICLGSLSFVLSDELLDLMVKIILQQIGKAEAERQSGHLLAIRTLIHTIGTISRSVGRRLRSHLGVMVPLFIRFCGRPSDQVTNAAPLSLPHNITRCLSHVGVGGRQ